MIRTSYLRAANSYEVLLRELASELHVLREEGKDYGHILEKMYPSISKMTQIMYSNHVGDTLPIDAKDYVVHELSTDIIERFKKKPDYTIHAWYVLIRFYLMRIKDNYVKKHMVRDTIPKNDIVKLLEGLGNSYCREFNLLSDAEDSVEYYRVSNLSDDAILSVTQDLSKFLGSEGSLSNSYLLLKALASDNIVIKRHIQYSYCERLREVVLHGKCSKQDK